MLRKISVKKVFCTPKQTRLKKRGGQRCNGSVEKPEVQAEMIREPGIQGFSLPLLPFLLLLFFGQAKKSKSKAN